MLAPSPNLGGVPLPANVVLHLPGLASLINKKWSSHDGCESIYFVVHQLVAKNIMRTVRTRLEREETTPW